MAQRFNPPPNWPRVPEGWTPPPGWQPDPAWGPIPDGWPLWIEDSPDNSRPRVRAAIFGAVCVVGAATIATVAFTVGHDPVPTAQKPAGEVQASGEQEPGPADRQPVEDNPPGPAGTLPDPDHTPTPTQPGASGPGRGLARPGPGRAPGTTPPPSSERSTGPYKYYADCDVARAAGAAPLHRGEPGYRTALDPDGDRIACDD